VKVVVQTAQNFTPFCPCYEPLPPSLFH